MNVDNEKIKRKEPKIVDAVSRTSPYLNILIPGIYQISRNDNVPGYLFITAAIVGLGMFLFSEIAFGISWSNYTDATTPGDATTYYNEASIWRTASMIGVGTWLGTVIASTIIAVIQDANNY
jgi:hypothetical protein